MNLLLLFVDEIVELYLEWCCDMLVMVNYAMGIREFMSLFMFGVLLLLCCWVSLKMVK